MRVHLQIWALGLLVTLVVCVVVGMNLERSAAQTVATRPAPSGPARWQVRDTEIVDGITYTVKLDIKEGAGSTCILVAQAVMGGTPSIEEIKMEACK